MKQRGRTPDETPDEWRFGHGIITNELMLTCNYCGSVHPDVFVQKLREGWRWICTDKNYYFQHLSDEQRREIVEMVNSGRVAFGESGLYRLPFFMSRSS